MANERYTENDYEQTLIQLFQGMGYEYNNWLLDDIELYSKVILDSCMREVCQK